MRAQSWPTNTSNEWPAEALPTPPKDAWEAPEPPDHATPLASPVMSTPTTRISTPSTAASSASSARRSSSLTSEARLAAVAARAAHLMDDVDRLRASNLEVPRLRRECGELRAAAARADGAEAAAAELSARLGTEAAARGAERADSARRTAALQADLAAARKAVDALASERDALRSPRTPLEEFYDARTAASMVSPSLRRPELVASATETLLRLPSARPRLADTTSVALSPDDRAVEVALLRANLHALRRETEQLRRAAAVTTPPLPPAEPETAAPVAPPLPPAEPEAEAAVDAPATPPPSGAFRSSPAEWDRLRAAMSSVSGACAEWEVELIGRDEAERLKLGRDPCEGPPTSRRAKLQVGGGCFALEADSWNRCTLLEHVSGVDYDARGTGLVRVAHDAGAHYFRVEARTVVAELIRAIEAGGGDIRATPTFREREAAVPASPGGAARAALRRRRRRGFR